MTSWLCDELTAVAEIVRYLVDQKKFGYLSNCHYCADRAISLPWPVPTFGSQRSKFHPNRFTFGWFIAGRVKAVKTRLKVFPILGEATASRRVLTSHRRPPSSMQFQHFVHACNFDFQRLSPCCSVSCISFHRGYIFTISLDHTTHWQLYCLYSLSNCV